VSAKEDQVSGNIRITLLDSREELGHGGGPNSGLLVAGLVMAMLGVVCVFRPIGTMTFATYLAAGGFLLVGITMLVAYIKTRNTLFAQDTASLWSCLLVLLVGVALIAHPLIGIKLVAAVTAVALVVSGIFQILIGLQLGLLESRIGTASGIVGLLMIIIGIITFVKPEWITIMGGIFAIAYGVLLIISSLPQEERMNGSWH
jgi:uncharacterized membrane protein HdeD (DUF308 family)